MANILLATPVAPNAHVQALYCWARRFRRLYPDSSSRVEAARMEAAQAALLGVFASHALLMAFALKLKMSAALRQPDKSSRQPGKISRVRSVTADAWQGVRSFLHVHGCMPLSLFDERVPAGTELPAQVCMETAPAASILPFPARTHDSIHTCCTVRANPQMHDLAVLTSSRPLEPCVCCVSSVQVLLG